MNVQERRLEAARRRDWVADHVQDLCEEAGGPVHVNVICAIAAEEFDVSGVTARRYVTNCIHRGSLVSPRVGYVWPRLCGPAPTPTEPLRVVRYGHAYILEGV
jgi:hypothetical protein